MLLLSMWLLAGLRYVLQHKVTVLHTRTRPFRKNNTGCCTQPDRVVLLYCQVSWLVDHDSWIMTHGSWLMAHDSWCTNQPAPQPKLHSVNKAHACQCRFTNYVHMHTQKNLMHTQARWRRGLPWSARDSPSTVEATTWRSEAWSSWWNLIWEEPELCLALLRSLLISNQQESRSVWQLSHVHSWVMADLIPAQSLLMPNQKGLRSASQSHVPTLVMAELSCQPGMLLIFKPAGLAQHMCMFDVLLTCCLQLLGLVSEPHSAHVHTVLPKQQAAIAVNNVLWHVIVTETTHLHLPHLHKIDVPEPVILLVHDTITIMVTSIVSGSINIIAHMCTYRWWSVMFTLPGITLVMMMVRVLCSNSMTGSGNYCNINFVQMGQWKQFDLCDNDMSSRILDCYCSFVLSQQLVTALLAGTASRNRNCFCIVTGAASRQIRVINYWAKAQRKNLRFLKTEQSRGCATTS